jgi:hypothetical protein
MRCYEAEAGTGTGTGTERLLLLVRNLHGMAGMAGWLGDVISRQALGNDGTWH